ncbi:MMPL family transporter, partial [bacterium]|nr:MMPL family transporter [bacterium]
CEMNYVMNDYYTIPDSKKGVANLWFFLEGNDVLDQLINHDATEGLLQAKLGTVNTRKMINTVDAINRHIDENIDTSLVHIQLTGLSSDFSKHIRDDMIERISKRIDYDAQEYNFKEINKTEIANILNKHIYTPFKYDNKGFKLVLSSRLNDYFSGGESDIEIKSIQDIKKIISEIVQLTSIGNPSEKQIIQLLHNCVPNRYYQDDPEILNYAAESISAIIKNEVEWQRVNSLVREIIPLFPKNLQNSRDFKKDLIGDVWEINETQMAAPYSDYVKYLKHVSINQQEKIKLDIKQTGMPIIFKDLDKNIIYSQFYSLTFAIILVFFLMIYQLKSIIRGLISLIPIILTILFNFTLMVLLNVPLDAVTVMVGSVAVGIGIDYTIHFNNRFHLEINRNNNEQEALNETLNTTGKSIIINAASVMMGFLVLIFGSIVPMQRFGWLISLTMLTSSISAITFLPAFILVSKVSFSWDLNHIIKDKQMKIKSKINNKVSSILIKKNKNGGKDVKN